MSHLMQSLLGYKYRKAADSQVGGVFRDMWRNTGQFEIGAVDHCAFAATFFWTNQILEALPVQATAIVLLTWEERVGKNKKESAEAEE